MAVDGERVRPIEAPLNLGDPAIESTGHDFD